MIEINGGSPQRGLLKKKWDYVQMRAGSRGGPGIEEELHDGAVAEETSNIQSCETIISYLVDVSTTVYQQPRHQYCELVIEIQILPTHTTPPSVSLSPSAIQTLHH